MAQVVLFNNIVTSYITVTRRDGSGDKSKDKSGRNVNAWKKEQSSLNSKQLDKSLFAGLTKELDDSKSDFSTKDSSFDDFSALDEYLGKPGEAAGKKD